MWPGALQGAPGHTTLHLTLRKEHTMAIVRVQHPAAVQHPDLPGQLVPLKLNDPYDDKDPLVRAYPWAFAADVEQATAAPGEKRTTSKP